MTHEPPEARLKACLGEAPQTHRKTQGPRKNLTMSEPTKSTAVATRPQDTIQHLLSSEDFKKKVALAIPRHLSADRFARIALVAINKNPKLVGCTKASLFQCLYDLSALGLEPDGRRAHLIPYGDKCTLIIDYKGIAELVRRSGEVSDLHADIICDGDEFSYCFGTGSHLKHKIELRKPRGEVIGAYSYVRLKDGTDSFDVMGKDEVEAIRKRSRSGSSGPWVTDWNEMAKKTVFRRHSKWLPLSPDLRDAIEKDEDVDLKGGTIDVGAGNVARSVFGGPDPVKNAKPVEEAAPEVETTPAEEAPAETPAPEQATGQNPVEPSSSWTSCKTSCSTTT
jgi:recombination protein RecT